MKIPDISKLQSSWTKYDSVKAIVIAKENDLRNAKLDEFKVDTPVFRHFLGVNSLTDPLPDFWKEIYDHPDQLGLFCLIAGLFTHHENITLFGEFADEEGMGGVLIMKAGDKHFTNLRSALVESGASKTIFRTASEVPYDLSTLFQSGEVGRIVRKLLENRLIIIGANKSDLENHFFELASELKFSRVFGLNEYQFKEWLQGSPISNSLIELQKNNITYEKYGKILALKTQQWLDDWDTVAKLGSQNRRRPEPYFYQFNIPALLLKRIYEVHSRKAFVGRQSDSFSQRKHSELRSNEIKEFVKGGFPWSTISTKQRESESYKNLQMPGWLPTSIIANILSSGSERKDRFIDEEDLIKIEHIDDNSAYILLPKKIWSDKWTPRVSPMEIIDGQHRIKAFDNIHHLAGSFNLPITAFYNLDFTWQAYLFYVINIKPKRINTSLAYDLMPLLRIQDWLEHDLNGPDIYRQVRAQELTDLLWNTPSSPWYNRINMLGETGPSKGGPVSQNAFVKSLVATFVKRWDGKDGGLFGAPITSGEEDVIQWDKETQAAFLILIWKCITHAIGKSKAEWVSSLRSSFIRKDGDQTYESLPIAFIHDHSFFTTDQGVRPTLHVFNDLCFVSNSFLKLNKFNSSVNYDKFTTQETVTLISNELSDTSRISDFVHAIANEIVNKFDWRTPSAFQRTDDPLEEQKRQRQNQFRGSGGYKEMRFQLLQILSESQEAITNEGQTISISEKAKEVRTKLGF